MLKRLHLMLLAAVTLAMAACAQATAPAPSGALPNQEARPLTEYRLGTGDKVRVIVFGEESLSGEFTVSSAGSLSFPLIGEVPASGLTTAELQTTLESRLGPDYLRNPRVSAEVLTYRPFYILGEVRKPGEYPYTNGLTVENAVATAEGFTYRADTRRVFIKRANATTETEFALDETTPPVQPGDTIRIRERFF